VTQKQSVAGRLEAIDQFRGFAILLMVLADYLAGISTVPAWLKHAPDIGYTIIDLIAPLFVFAMGLTFGLSFRRRAARDGYWRCYEHFIARNLALIGLGFLLTLGGNLTGVYPSTVNWGLLQALGAAGLIALVVIRLPVIWRAVFGLGLLAVYQILLDRFWLADVIAAPHNGPWGALSWGAMLILATVLADLYHGDPAVVGDPERARRIYLWASLAVLGAGLALTLVAPISKHRASASFVLVSLGLSALIFYSFHLLSARTTLRMPVLLGAWGRNALLLYVLHGVVIGFFALPPYPGWYIEAPWWLIILQAGALLGILSAVGLYLDRRRLYWTL
jgi:predicted acyltransferase